MIPNMTPTPHNSADARDFAKTVLMPGDPLRAKYLADHFLDSAVLVNNVRGVQGYTGTYRGKPVSVMASGMGCPSIGIYSYELFNFYDVDRIIRIGSAGGLSSDVHLRDIIIEMSAYTDSGYVRALGFRGNVAPCCSWPLLKKAMQRAEELQLPVHAGPVFSSDVFYNTVNPNELLTKLGVLAVEMESAALYINAAMAHKEALTICTVSDIPATGESTDSAERQEGFTQMMELALSLL